MKLTKDKFMLFCLAWTAFFSVLALLTSKFYFLSLSLIPLAVYELIRTQGIKNTKPLSLATLILLAIQFLHASKLFLFPLDISFIIGILPFALPPGSDPLLITSILLLAFFSLLLIKYTWGSVTKFIAILLLAGAALQVYFFWTDISPIIKSPFVQKILDSQQHRIRDNLHYRLERELSF